MDALTSRLQAREIKTRKADQERRADRLGKTVMTVDT
jgi:hypothetical protein